MNKRGFELQFNIIFVIIVGLIVFGFFMFFTFKYIDLQKEKESVEIARSMDNIIRGLKSTTQYKEFDINFDFDMDVDCDSITINNGLYGQKIDSIFFASPGRGKNIWFWSQNLQKPFRIDTLLFIVDNSKKYYSNKPGFFPEFINEGSSNDYEVGIFFEGFSGYCPTAMNGKKVVCVDSNNIFIDGTEFPFIDDSLVYGAAFASEDQFNCSLNKIVEKWINLIDIYLSKNDRSNDCSSVREGVKTELNIIKNSLSSNNFAFDVEGLRRENGRLSDHDCEVIY
jgi:hypothetical protein